MGNKTKREERLGNINYNKLGEKFKIIEYKNALNINIEFEDGTILKNRKYEDFKNGSILKPNWIYEKYLNEERYNNQGSLMKIININENLSNIDVQFIDNYNFLMKSQQYSNFKKGCIKNPYYPSVLGHGYTGESKIEHKSNSYWRGMLYRCYNKDYHNKKPSYENCTICEEWLNYSNFKKWYEENYYEVENEQMDLDKDILVKNNKIYSPETCIFVPKRINTLFVTKYKSKTETLVGVSRSESSTYISTVSKGRSRIYLGSFKTESEAFEEYKKAKEEYVKEIAEEYKYRIPNKLYNAMYSWKVVGIK